MSDRPKVTRVLLLRKFAIVFLCVATFFVIGYSLVALFAYIRGPGRSVAEAGQRERPLLERQPGERHEPSPTVLLDDGSTRAALCATLRERAVSEAEIQSRYGPNATDSPPAQGPERTPEESEDIAYFQNPPSGLANLEIVPAPRVLNMRMLGAPCEDFEAWAVALPMADRDQRTIGYASASAGFTFALPDGREVFLAPTSTGDSHSDFGTYLASILMSDGAATPLTLLAGGGTWGGQGDLFIPLHQPLGAFHVWQDGGGMWQGYVQGWIGVTDFAGSTPRAVANFPAYASFPCDGDGRERCIDYRLASISYSENGPDELSITWRLTSYTVNERGQRGDLRSREVSAGYELRAGEYMRVRGEEPPRA